MQLVKEIAIYLIIVNILSSLMPDDSYKKYLKAVSGIILILIIIQPLHILFNESELEDMIEKQLQESNIVELDKSLSGINEEIGKSAKKIYQEEVINSIHEFLEQNDIQAENIEVEMEINEDDQIVISEILIELEENSIFDENGKQQDNYAAETRNLYVRNLIAEAYKMDKELVDVE